MTFCTINLHTAVWYQVFGSNTNNQKELFDPKICPEHVISIRIRVDLGVMKMNGYFALSRT